MINLESYLIPATEADTDPMSTKEKIKAYAAGILITALGIASIKWAHDDKKRLKEREKQNALNKAAEDAKEKARKEEFEKYKSSPEYEKDCKYISNKYRVDYPNNYDRKTLANNLEDAVEKDLKKMANAINRDKKLCNALAEKYLSWCKNDIDHFEKYRKSYENEANEIKVNPACGNTFEVYDDVYEFEISDLSQGPRTWVCSELLFPEFCQAINAKYYREIKLGIMSKMRDLGDGDEGLIGYTFCG